MLHNKELIIDEKLQVDHINHDSLDNRACNLRLVTQSVNQQNKRKYRNSSSEYKGVSWDEKAGKWMARISINGKRLYAGLHVEEDGAARAVYELCKKHGREDTLNFYEDLTIKDQYGVYAKERSTLKTIIKKDRPFVCCITGATENLHMHHLKDVDTYPELFYTPENIVVLTEKLHYEFHSKYGQTKTTPAQFSEFKKEKPAT
jgi:5-methylcytosine-specific restriction endonuclease McrA